MFCIFILSRGVYDLKKHILKDYYDIIMDTTKPEYMENWMDFDRIYMFNFKSLRKEISNPMIPYDFIIDTLKIRNIELVDSNRFCIKLEYDSTVEFLVFDNVIEAWKFYNYIRSLYLNAIECQNSLCYDIKINLRILFDDLRFNSMENVFMVLIDNYNYNYNKKIAEKQKIIGSEDQINFKSIIEFYELFLTAYYSLADYSSNFDKLRIFVNRFHELYLEYIKEILTNPYSEVS